jgi:hypothetical protein
MDIEHEAGRLHDATSLLGRMRRNESLVGLELPHMAGLWH